MAKPISPKEVKEEQISRIPDYVIEAFNELLVQKIANKEAITIDQDEVIELILRKAPSEMTRGRLMKEDLLDIEPLFEREGWNVSYDKPGWDEGYTPRFIFKMKSQEL